MITPYPSVTRVFTVTEPNDMLFLDYFYKRCIAAGEPVPVQQTPPRRSLIRRIFNWMAPPI